MSGWVDVPFWEVVIWAFLFSLSNAAWTAIRNRWERRKAPLFMDWQGATRWATDHPGRLALFPNGQVRAGSRR